MKKDKLREKINECTVEAWNTLVDTVEKQEREDWWRVYERLTWAREYIDRIQ